MSAKTLILDLAAIGGVSIEHLIPYATWHKNGRYFPGEAGVEHYRLLAALAAQMDAGVTIADLGTYLGYSALALSSNEQIQVVTYDISDWMPNDVLTAKRRANVSVRLKDCNDAVEELASCPLILLDVDPHDGVQERRLLQALLDARYRGIVVMDDVFVDRDMRKCWDWIPLKKIDATRFGHATGTGLIVFDPDTIDVVTTS